MKSKFIISLSIVTVLSLTSAVLASEESLREAEVFFENFIALEHSFDAAVADLYSDSALIKSTRHYPHGAVRELVLPAPQYKGLIRQAMGLAKARGDTSTYSGCSFKDEGERVRIKCTRFSDLKKYESPYELLVGPGESGSWLIFEEISQTQP